MYQKFKPERFVRARFCTFVPECSGAVEIQERFCYAEFNKTKLHFSFTIYKKQEAFFMKLAIGNDHVALAMKNEIRAYLENCDIEVIDVGTNSANRFNYPISGYKVARMVASGEVDGGVLICGTGVGISLAANKVHGIRACVCSDPYTARLSKQHNNTNIVAFGARVIGIETAKMILDEWLAAEYEGSRHQTRIDMIAEIETTQALKGVD